MSGPATRRSGLGVALMIGAGLAWSTGGIIVRNVEHQEGAELVFWRSVFMAATLAVYLIAVYGRWAPAKVLAMGWAGVYSGLFLGATFYFFLYALTFTTVANTLVIMSMTPFVTAVVGRIVLHEHVPARTWATMAAGTCGIAVMFWDSLGSGGQLIGNALAFGVSLAYAGNIVVLRRVGTRVDMVPSVFLAGGFSAGLALPLAWPLEAGGHDVAALALMGVVQLGLGCVLATVAIRHLRAAEVGLLALLEVVLGPLWVWLGIGERPSDLALAGGAIVLSALVLNEVLGAMARRPASAPPPP